MTESETVALLCELLYTREPFVHVRFGDGDVFFATGTGPVLTGDGEEWSPELSKRLMDAWVALADVKHLLLGDLYTYAVSDGCEEQWAGLLAGLLISRGLAKTPDPTMVHMEALRVGFGHALPVYQAIRDDPRRKILVASQAVGSKMAPLLDCEWVGVSLHTAWQEADDIVRLVEGREPEVVLFAAGRGGKIMQGKLADSMPHLTQIDIGSGLDLLTDDGVRRGTDLRVNRRKVLAEYREAGLAPA